MRQLFITLSLLFLTFSCQSDEFSFEFDSITVSPNVVKDGKNCVCVVYSADIRNAVGHELYVVATIYSAHGKKVMASSSSHRMADGSIGACTKLKVKKKRASTKMQKISIPFEDIPIPSDAEGPWYVRCSVVVDENPTTEADCQVATESDYIPFDIDRYTGKKSKKGKRSNGQSSEGYTETHTNNGQDNYTVFDMGGGRGRVHIWEHADGSRTIKNEWLCHACMGSKKCNICQGTGNAYWIINRYHPCSACAATPGTCTTCQGTGYTSFTKTWKPGEAEAYLQARREVEAQYRQNGGSSSGSTGGGTCPRCGGRGFSGTSYEYAAASTSGWMQPYHHRGGSGCPHCSSARDHYHYPCTECHGYGHL